MKVTIEIEVPQSIDLQHAFTSVTDALENADNVTEDEHILVYKILKNLKNQNTTS